MTILSIIKNAIYSHFFHIPVIRAISEAGKWICMYNIQLLYVYMYENFDLFSMRKGGFSEGAGDEIPIRVRPLPHPPATTPPITRESALDISRAFIYQTIFCQS